MDACFVQTLRTEANVSKTRVGADNIDLFHVVTEYEKFYELKFGRMPKLIRKVATAEKSRGTSKRRSSVRGPPSSASKPGATAATAATAAEMAPAVSAKENASPASQLSLDGKAIAAKASNEPMGYAREDDGRCQKLLKPLPTEGRDPQLQGLVQVISRDIFSQNPNVRWADIVGAPNAKRLLQVCAVSHTRFHLIPSFGFVLFHFSSFDSIFSMEIYTDFPGVC